ncbi:MAG: pyruvate ferredoxin oxidoreductase [Proteobacteria bacterium]|nr:pyruvate ferredoxin oxidoreductase [Pseudomonadota bacterium]
MGKVQEITVWASGVVQDKEARDVAQCLAAAAAKEGKFIQAFDNYVDLPDRVNVPVRKYARISDSEIEEKYEYENHNPEIVILVEPTLVKGVDVLRGMEGDGSLIVNTSRSPEEILKFIPDKKPLKKIACVDAMEICPKAVIDFSGSEGAVEAGGVGVGIGAVLAGAAAKVSGCVKIESLMSEVGNPEAAKRGFDEVTIKEL